MSKRLLLLFALCGCRHSVAESAAPAPSVETGGFIATLGTDTLHIEQFTTTPDAMRGTIVTRIPTTRIINWSLTLDSAGLPRRYTAETHDTDLRPLRHNGAAGSIDFGDSTFRMTLRNGESVKNHIPAPRQTFPAAGVPYIGVSYLMYEAAFADARAHAAARGDTSLWMLTLSPAQLASVRMRAWLVGADSAELSYFGISKSGYRFDDNGRLMSADWTATTYRYRVRRIAETDVIAIAQRWATADRSGKALGALSPRDTARTTVGDAEILIDYSRPAKRGRVIWGDIVPWDTVWRLGADMATHFTTSRELVIGGTTVPAGRYTLWMIPSHERPLLVISSAVNVFGTAYNPAKDFARVPMKQVAPVAEMERLTISIEIDALVVRWDEIAWSVPIAVK